MKKVLLLLSITFLLTSCVKKSLLEDAEAEIEVLENQNLSLEGQVLQLGTQITTLTNSNASLISENANIASDLADVNEALAEANASLADANIERATLTAQVEGLTAQVVALQYAVDVENVYKIELKIESIEEEIVDALVNIGFFVTPGNGGYDADGDYITTLADIVGTTSSTLTTELGIAAGYQANYDAFKVEVDAGNETSGNLADLYIVLHEHRIGDLKDAQDAYDIAKANLDAAAAPLVAIYDALIVELEAWEAKLEELISTVTL